MFTTKFKIILAAVLIAIGVACVVTSLLLLHLRVSKLEKQPAQVLVEKQMEATPSATPLPTQGVKRVVETLTPTVTK